MNGIKHDFRVNNFNFKFLSQIKKRLGNGFQLSHCVVGKPTAFASVMQMKSLLGFIVAEVRRGTKSKVRNSKTIIAWNDVLNLYYFPITNRLTNYRG